MENLIKQYQSMDVFLLLRVVLEEFKNDIIKLNKEQLLKGNKADGTDLPGYTDAYAALKNKPKRPKTLKDKGDFHAGFDANFFKNYYEAFSRDPKEGFLIKNWGNEIFGLTEQSKAIILPLVESKLVDYIKKRK